MATAPHAILPLSKLCPQVTDWVESVRHLTEPTSVYWCEGSEEEMARLTAELEASVASSRSLIRHTSRAAISPAPIRRMSRASSI